MTIQPPTTEFELAVLATEFAPLPLTARLQRLREMVTGPLVFTTSFGLEDQALTHAVVESEIDVSFATLDTGRLFDETLQLWAETELRYGIRIQPFAPDTVLLQGLVTSQGPLGFRRSIAERQECCAVRKVEPLRRALAGAGGWLTGLRSDQSPSRASTLWISRDAELRLVKLSPLSDWSREQVARYVRSHDVPFNALHERGFASIGCAPCTRAILPGEDERAGRWWWEAEARRECGLHARPSAEVLTLREEAVR